MEEINSGRLSPANFSQTAVHPKPEDPWAIDWIFVVDTLNFCFWKPDNEAGWEVDGYTGYFALCAAVNRAMRENKDFLNPKFYSTITEEQLKKVLRSDTSVEVPLLSERVKCLHEVGSALLENFDGSFVNCVRIADQSALTLLRLIVENFKCFRDEAIYKGHKVAFYKRAQILVADIWACFKGEGAGPFKDIDEITMFPDYRVPQSLLFYGVFEYSEELLEKLKKQTILNNGDEEEVEIRGCSIHAVELVKNLAQEKLGHDKVNSILVDYYLWDFRRKYDMELKKQGLPFHKTFSIYY